MFTIAKRISLVAVGLGASRLISTIVKQTTNPNMPPAAKLGVVVGAVAVSALMADATARGVESQIDGLERRIKNKNV